MSAAVQSTLRRPALQGLARRRLAVACLSTVGMLLTAGCAGSAASPSTSVPARSTPRAVAVLPLTGGAGAEGLGFAVAEILARDLALVPRLRVVERARLDAVLKELGLGATGRVAPATVPRAGQLLGAERLLSGTVTRTANGANIDVTMLDVATGTTESVYAERLDLNGVIDAQERLAEQAFTRLGVTLTPAERERLAKRPTRRVDALIAFGNGRRAEAMGNAAQARTFYQQAVQLDPAFVEAAQALDPTATVAATPTGAGPLNTGARLPFDLLLDDLMLSVTDRVVRSAAPPAVCPPICPALSGATGTLVVRIRP